MKQRIRNFIRRVFGLLRLSDKLDRIDIATQALINAQRLKAVAENCQWLKYKSFITGRWAMDNAALYTLCRILNNMKPKNILEFGLGQSSFMIHQYANFYEDVSALTIEHDKEWITFFMNGIQKDIHISTKQYDKEFVKYKEFETLTYKNMNELQGEVYDFFVVDGPFGSEHYSRSQIIDFVQENLPERFCILIDDSERNGEKETIEEVCKIFTNQKIEYYVVNYPGEKKEHTVICSNNLKFLTSL